MLEAYPDIKKQAEQYFATHELTPDDETLMTLFISGIKGANVMVLSKVEYQPMVWEPYRYMHQQYYKDYELYSLLLKATRWSMNPLLYVKGSEWNAKLWSKANLPNYIMGTFDRDSRFFRYLALSHAFKTEMRFVPLFPIDKELKTPFLSTLYDIEVEGGKEIQTQIALLKYMDVPNLSLEEKEQIVREQRDIVMTHLAEFLDYFVNRNNIEAAAASGQK